MADDDIVHPRPDQAEEPVEDIGASNVDLDQARHGVTHPSPAAPEPGLGEHPVADDHGHDDHGHDDHGPDDHGHDDHGPDDHGDHPVEDPRWVAAPLLVGLVVGVVLIIVLGLAAGADPTHTL